MASAMSDVNNMKATTCDWCFREAPVQTIHEELWDFWKKISTEDQNLVSYKNICGSCKSRYEEFSIYTKKWKNHASVIDKILSLEQIKDEPIDTEYHPSIKKEELGSIQFTVSRGVPVVFPGLLPCCSNSLDSPSPREMKSEFNASLTEKVWPSRKIKAEPLIDIEDHLINESVCKEEMSDLDYPTVSNDKGEKGSVSRAVLERAVLPGSITFKEKPNATLICSYCNKTFNSSASLKRHMCMHIGENIFKCPKCDKCFTCSYYLSVHKCIHTGEEPFKCPQCDKRFITSNLKRHIIHVHSGGRPFKCSQCDKCFTTSSHLKRHILVHSVEKPFKRPQCGKRFITSHLKQHIHVYSGDKPFKCPQCYKRFITFSHLKQHCAHFY